MPDIPGVERACADWLRDQVGEPVRVDESTLLFANDVKFNKRTGWLSLPRAEQKEYRHFGMHKLLEDPGSFRPDAGRMDRRALQ